MNVRLILLLLFVNIAAAFRQYRRCADSEPTLHGSGGELIPRRWGKKAGALPADGRY